MDNKALGRIGEEAAAEVMRAKGYCILKRNYRCRYGEIDIIAERYGDMSFVEVKTRQNFRFGRPCEAVDEDKKGRIRRAASCYLDEMREKGYVPRHYDFQVVEIVMNHMENAF